MLGRMMHPCRLLAAVVPCVLALACFEDVPPLPSGEGTETGETTGDGDGDGDNNTAPTIDSFTINASATPTPIEAAGAIALQALASDPDGDLERVDFETGDQLIPTSTATPS